MTSTSERLEKIREWVARGCPAIPRTFKIEPTTDCRAWLLTIEVIERPSGEPYPRMLSVSDRDFDVAVERFDAHMGRFGFR